MKLWEVVEYKPAMVTGENKLNYHFLGAGGPNEVFSLYELYKN